MNTLVRIREDNSSFSGMHFLFLVFIEYFSISLLTAVLLQVLLQITIAIEHRVANLFKDKPGIRPKILRALSA